MSGPNIKVLSLEDLGVIGDVVEDGNTLEENALKKAWFAYRSAYHQDRVYVADDTGFSIDALYGRPGIHAARWADIELGRTLSTEEIMNFTLNKLKGVPREKRTATFTTIAVVISDTIITDNVFVGKCKGTILEEPRTQCQPNMPYSAIFVPYGQPWTWAEMSTEEENIVSHRGIAFRRLLKFLNGQIS